MPLPEDWRGFIESLNLSGVEYLIVGAVALAHHGFPRYAGALDVFVRNTPENAQRLEAALARFGFGSVGLKAADFVNSYQVIQLGVAPNRVDLLTSLTGVTFEDLQHTRWCHAVQNHILVVVSAGRQQGTVGRKRHRGNLPRVRLKFREFATVVPIPEPHPAGVVANRHQPAII